LTTIPSDRDKDKDKDKDKDIDKGERSSLPPIFNKDDIISDHD